MSAVPPPSPRPDAAPTTEEQQRRKTAGRWVLWQTLALLVTLLSAGLLLPFKLLAIPAGVAAAVVGVRAWMATRGLRRTEFLRIAIGMGTTVGLAVAALALSTLFFWDQSIALQECLHGALTEAATAACQREFSDSVTQLGNLFSGTR